MIDRYKLFKMKRRLLNYVWNCWICRKGTGGAAAAARPVQAGIPRL